MDFKQKIAVVLKLIFMKLNQKSSLECIIPYRCIQSGGLYIKDRICLIRLSRESANYAY